MSLRYELYRFKRRFGCKHNPTHVTADILEGGAESQVQWCRDCGAYRFVFDPWGQRPRIGDWSIPSKWWSR
jgi:hypothetical protein